MTSIRIVAVVILSGVVLQTGLHLSASAQSSAPPQPATTPLGQELERCKALHAQAATDPRCQAAYRKSREQFFGSGISPYDPKPIDIFPKTPDRPLTTPKTTPEP